ncbi:hypothetical protein [Swaminathania salitolerans]|uniref:Uncharacterized protein n=1 Tax=Swaminathania salitolerans TaxID=182838 RepID=A0A511BP46_9PROT|nr:hypothetical protein [Swaminathania salitolerans]GBQ10631.1 hypothetical protein AA21291_0501 [Swaminathania salitolerans LMG 21291]GEL02109.1 hypothetical protein SSA02_12720 [Swaminathania salitolerans]
MRQPILLLLALIASIPRIASAGSFTVTDDRAPNEVSEVSRLYLDGNLAAIFRLDDKTPSLTRTITTPSGRVNHSYALCGQITIVNAEGRSETHRVSSEGTLFNPDGHHLVALGDDNFTQFFLRDPLDPSVAKRLPGHSGICASPIS